MATTVTLQDSMTREPREVSPIDGETYRFYCCGPTVYGPAHIGNFRTFVVQDTFRRVLECAGIATKHVRNVTDVDDKTIRESQAQGQTLGDFTKHWKDKFSADCVALNMLEPHIEPGAVDHIPHQVRMIEALIEKGNAYEKEGSVYFSVKSFPGYGRLSRVADRELKLGAAQTANDSDEYDKDSLADFVLWKGRKPEDGDNYWHSPWGEGRPGWHLECSAMSLEYLGETFDMHSGGVDLMFPHHENEIAQSECCSGTTFAHHWFHITHLLVDGGKMSKSLGNFYTLADLEEKGYTPEELRYVYLSGHYRHHLNFTLDSLLASRQAMNRLSRFEKSLAERAQTSKVPDYETARQAGEAGPFQPAFEALCRDLNTPDALGKIFTAIKSIDTKTLSQPIAAKLYQQYHFILAALGLQLLEKEENREDIPQEIKAMAEERWQARSAKEWAESDRLRDELSEAGWLVQDGKEGYTVIRK